MYNKITKTETVCKAKLEYIVKNWDGLDFRASVDDDNEWDARKICKDYLDRLDNKGSKKTFYKQNNDQGRYFAVKGLSLQSMPREVRHTIAKDLYWDIDFVNCHPQLLAQFCKKNNIPCAALNSYVGQRDPLFKLLLAKNKNMTRDDIKEVVLSIMNGGKKAYDAVENKPNWLNVFYYEMRSILESISALDKDAFEAQKKRRIKLKKDYNYEGSYVNTILCDLENQAVQCLDSFITSKGFDVDVLVFDGLMVRKDKGKELTPELLEEASKLIETHTGYSLCIVEKPMDQGFPIPDVMSEYQQWKADFEKTNCKIKNITQYLEVDTKDKNLVFRTEDKLLAAYRNCSFIKDWIQDENIKTYRKIDFLPHPLPQEEDVFNTFSGFAVQSLDGMIYSEECIQPIIRHIGYLVNHDQKGIDYMLNWLANIFQTPGRTTNTAIIIKSKEGVGKNVLFNFLNSIIGKEYCIGTSDPENDCFGSFNNLLMNKLLINLNETKQEDTAKYIELIKTYITETKIQLKLKGRDSIQVNNFMRWIFFTNRELPFKLGRGQRRFWGVEADSSMANNREYMLKLINACEDKQVQFSFYTYLMNRDISQFDFINDRPKTSFTESMVSAGSDKIAEFLEHIKETHVDDLVNNKLVIQASLLFKEYCKFLVEACEMEKTNPTAFGYAMKDYKQVSKTRDTYGIKYTIDYN